MSLIVYGRLEINCSTPQLGSSRYLTKYFTCTVYRLAAGNVLSLPLPILSFILLHFLSKKIASKQMQCTFCVCFKSLCGSQNFFDRLKVDIYQTCGSIDSALVFWLSYLLPVRPENQRIAQFELFKFFRFSTNQLLFVPFLLWSHLNRFIVDTCPSRIKQKTKKRKNYDSFLRMARCCRQLQVKGLTLERHMLQTSLTRQLLPVVTRYTPSLSLRPVRQ